MLVSQGVDLDRATLALWMGRPAWWRFFNHWKD
jgi:hypothetical protein